MIFRDIVKNPFRVFLLFALWGVVIYSNTFDASFHYDDNHNIVNNPSLHWNELSWENFEKTFSSIVRPVSNLTFALDYYFGGLDVSHFHYVNTAVHILTAFGVFLLLKTIFGIPRFAGETGERGDIIAFIASLMWLTSPLQTQAVTYIVQRMAELAAMFYVYALYFFIKGRLDTEGRGYLFYSLAGLFALLAFGSKQNAYTLPFYMLLSEIVFFRGGDATFLLRKRVVVASFFIGLISVWLLWKVYYEPEPMLISPGMWFLQWLKSRFLTGIRVIVFYLNQLLIPVPSRLCLVHDFPLSRSLGSPPSTLFALLFVGSVFTFSLLWIRKRPLFSFFTLWFLGNLAIETFYPWLTLVFEHRVYLPSIGFFALAALGYERVARSLDGRHIIRRCTAATVVILLLLFSVNTFVRNMAWKDDITLWTDVAQKSPKQAIGYMALGVANINRESFEEALSYYKMAESLEPTNPKIWYGLGISYYGLRRYNDAVREFERFGSTGYLGPVNDPTISYFFSLVARELYGQGRRGAAIDVIDRALTYDPGEPELVELKEKMQSGKITYEELRQK